MIVGSLATAIDEAIVCAVKARNYDATFGQKMKEARRIAEEQGEAWETVLETVVRPKLQAAVGDRQVRRLIAIARAEDPEIADNAERTATRQRMAKIGRTTSAERNMPPLQKALAAVNALPPEERRQVAEIADVGARKAIAAPSIPPSEALARAIAAVDDDTLRAVLVRPEIWGRLRILLSTGRATDATDSETGEILEDAQRPPNRDASAGDSRTGIDASAGTPGMPAGSGAISREGAGDTDEAVVGNQANAPVPVREQPGPTAAGPTPCPAVSPLGVQEPASGGDDRSHPSPSAPAPKPDDAFAIPEFLRRGTA